VVVPLAAQRPLPMPETAKLSSGALRPTRSMQRPASTPRVSAWSASFPPACAMTTALLTRDRTLRDAARRREPRESSRKDQARRVQAIFHDPYGSLNPRRRIGSIASPLIVEEAETRSLFTAPRYLYARVPLAWC